MKRFVTLLFCAIGMLYSWPGIAGALDNLKGPAEKLIDQQIHQPIPQPVSAKKETPVVKNGSGEIKKLSTFLSFPLKCGRVDINNNCIFPYTDGAYTQKSINSVLDHHMDYPYVADGAVMAFTGEEGKGAPRKMGCYPKVGGSVFIISGLYKGTVVYNDDGSIKEDCRASAGLNYDGHPGYDYKADEGMVVKAAYGGKVVNGRCVPRGIDKTGGCEAWGYVGIDHGNGYVTQYGHLTDITVHEGDSVKKGDQIGKTGQTSPPYTDKNGIYHEFSVPPHLHFEVLKVKEGAPYGYTFVDPYGWEGSPNEDYLENVTKIKNVCLWDDYPPGACTHSAIKDDIHRIDFRNFTYEIGKSWCADVLGKTVVQVRNGESESTNKEHPLDGFSLGIDASRIFYGDLTGDERDEAVVLTYCGGMHPEEQAFIYTMRNGRAVLLTKLEEGNRAFGGIVFGYLCQGCSDGIKIQNGLLTVERMWGDGACCPKDIEKKVYRWNGRQLIQVGKAQRRKFIGR